MESEPGVSIKIPSTSFGKKIKIAMVEQEISQKELAGKLGIASSTLSDVIYGRNFSIRTMEYIAKELGIELKL